MRTMIAAAPVAGGPSAPALAQEPGAGPFESQSRSLPDPNKSTPRRGFVPGSTARPNRISAVAATGTGPTDPIA
jgi:hypothetical protein